jgi:hypothetical protein
MQKPLGRLAPLGRWIALLGLVFATWVPRLSGPLDLHFDASIYYTLGTSLAEGRGYRLGNEPGAIEALQYPPLLAGFVALHERALGTSDPLVVAPALRVSFCLLNLALAAAVYALARRLLSEPEAFLATLAALLGFRTIYLSDLLFAELPFACASALFLLTARLEGRAAKLASVAFLWTAFGLRSAGIALLAAWVAEALLARRWRAAALRTALAAVPVLAWALYVHGVQTSAEYAHPAYPYQRAAYQYANVDYATNAALVDSFRPELGTVDARGLVARVAVNASYLPLVLGECVSISVDYAEELADTLALELGFPLVPRWIATPLLVLLTLLVVFGLGELFRSGERLLPLYVVFSLALICLTPWPRQWWRYLQPLTFVLAIALGRAVLTLRRATARARPRLARAGAVVFWVALFGAQAFALRQLFAGSRSWSELHDPAGASVSARSFFLEPEWRSYERGLGWLATNARAPAVVATSAPHFAHVNTGLLCIFPPFEADAAEAQRLLDAVPVEFVMLDSLWFLNVSARYAEPVVRANPERWSLAYSDPVAKLEIWRRIPSETR